MPYLLAVVIWLSLADFGLALTGNAPPATSFPARSIVMIVDARRDLCTGTVLASDLILTAAHCLMRPVDYQVRTFTGGQPISTRSIVVHPHFNPKSYAAARATADLALVRLNEPLTGLVAPATLAVARRVAIGEKLIIAGFGFRVAGTDQGLGLPRMATLAVTGKPGSLQIRLVDPSTNNGRSGLGACTGDSGAPVFESSGAQIDVVSWTTGPEDTEGCGGLSDAQPIATLGVSKRKSRSRT
jgi:secreted trypsin-like serine protease